MEQKKASIIIPCWNAGNWIRESVASALSQTYRPLEVIVVDDGSIDGVTQQILRTLHDPRLRVFFRPHHGVAEARNFAIHQAAGDYILPLDADDGIEPGYLAACIDVLGTHPEVGMVYSRADCFGEDSGPWHLPDFTLGEMLVHNVIYNAGAFRKADFLRTTGYDQQLPCWEDWDFWLSLLALELRPWRLDEVYFHYRVHSGSRSWTQNTVPKLLQAQRYILQKHANLFQAHVAEYGMAFHQRLYTEKQKGIDDAGKIWRSQASGNRWLQMAQAIPWEQAEQRFAGCLPELTGVPHPVRLAVGILLVQAELGCSDAETVRQVEENPFIRAFCGLPDQRVHIPVEVIAYAHAVFDGERMREFQAMLQDAAR